MKVNQRSLYFPVFKLNYTLFNEIILIEADAETYDIVNLSSSQLEVIEADSYWCLANILDGIQVYIYCYMISKYGFIYVT